MIISGKEKDASGVPYKDKVTSAAGLKALEKILRGQTSLYSPKLTWRQSTVRKASAASSDVRKIGQIDDPDGRQPSLDEGRTWLLNGVTQSQEGSAYRIEREWISDSGKAGKCSNSVRFALVEGSKILLFEAAAWVSGMSGILIG